MTKRQLENALRLTEGVTDEFFVEPLLGDQEAAFKFVAKADHALMRNVTDMIMEVVTPVTKTRGKLSYGVSCLIRRGAGEELIEYHKVFKTVDYDSVAQLKQLVWEREERRLDLSDESKCGTNPIFQQV